MRSDLMYCNNVSANIDADCPRCVEAVIRRCRKADEGLRRIWEVIDGDQNPLAGRLKRIVVEALTDTRILILLLLPWAILGGVM